MPECVLWRVYFQVEVQIEIHSIDPGSRFISSFDKKFAITEKKKESFTWLNVDHSNIKLE